MRYTLRLAAVLAALLCASTIQAQEVGGYPNATVPLAGNERILADQQGNTVDITPAQLQSYVFPGGVVPVLLGGTGVNNLIGLLKGNGTSPVTSAGAADVYNLWTSPSSACYLRGDGVCASPSGAGTVTTSGSPTTGAIVAFSGATAITNATWANFSTLLTGTCNSGTVVFGNGSCGTVSGTGTVTSISGSSSFPGLTITPGPITTSGTLAISATGALTQGLFIATPAAASGAVQLRAIVTSDLPIVAGAQGGTGVANTGDTITLAGNVVTQGGAMTLDETANNSTMLVPNASPRNISSATPYTTLLSDCNGIINYTNSGTNSITVAANASVACPVSSKMRILANDGAGTLSLGIGGSDTLELLPTGTTTPIQVASPGFADVFKVSATKWWVSGQNVTSGTTLLAYFGTLGFTKAGALFGAFLNPFDATPVDSINTATPSFGSLTQACGNSGGAGSGTVCGVNTGALPALIGIFAACAGNVTSPTSIGGGGCNIEASNSSPNDWLSLAEAALHAGYIVNIIWSPNNPAGNGSNPWPDLINSGTATNTTFIGWLNNFATDLKALAAIGPFILSPVGELNIPAGIPGGGSGGCLTYASYCNFATINAQSSGVPTSSQVGQMYQLILNTLVTAGVPRNMFLYNFETNFGQGNNCTGWVANTFDITSADTQPATINSSGDYATLTGPGNCGHGLPFWMGSLASSGNPGTQNPNTVNTYNSVNQEMTSGTYVSMFGLELWGQGSALPQQTGATAALTTPPWLDKADIPASFTSAKYRSAPPAIIDAGAGIEVANDADFYAPVKRVSGWR